MNTRQAKDKTAGKLSNSQANKPTSYQAASINPGRLLLVGAQDISERDKVGALAYQLSQPGAVQLGADVVRDPCQHQPYPSLLQEDRNRPQRFSR